MSSENSFAGIILPSRLQGLLTKVAAKDGYVTILPNLGEYDLRPEIPGTEGEFEQKQRRIALNTIRHRINPYQKQKVLEAILLFGKAFVVENLFFDFSPLVNEGFLAILKPEDYYSFYTFDVERAQHIRPVFDALDWTMFRNNRSEFSRRFDTYCQLLTDFQSIAGDFPREQKLKYEQELEKPFEVCLDLLHIFVLAIQDAENYLSYSNALHAPLLIEAPRLGKPGFLSAEHDGLGSASNVVRTYRVFLNEIGSMPIIQSVDDVKRLSKHPALYDFRIAIWEWSKALQSGNITEETRFRKAIQDANTGLAKASKLNRITRYLSYISIPISIASVFIGMPLGLLLMPVSLGLRLTSDQLERENRWITFGR